MPSNAQLVDRLIDILVELEGIKETDAKTIKKTFEDSPIDHFDLFLVDEGLVDKKTMLLALSQCFSVPSFDVVGHFFDTNLLTMFPKTKLFNNAVIPLKVDEGILFMVTSNPDVSGLESSLREHVSYDINFFVGLRLNIRDAIEEFYDPSLTEGYDPNVVEHETPEEQIEITEEKD